MKKSTHSVILMHFIILMASSCIVPKNAASINETFPALSYEGHRGARGLYPENSITAMKAAIDLPKVTTLEMDCHITKDKKVVVYHDDYLNPKFVTYTNGNELVKPDLKGIIYQYKWAELKRFDIGSKYNPDFPEQKKVKTTIPQLRQLITEAEAYAKLKRQAPMFYNIETKSQEDKDHIYHPAPHEFADLVLEVVIEKGIAPRTVIQSFDKRTIQYIHKSYPQIKTSYLIDAKVTKSVAELINELGFKPFIISPHYKLVNADFVKQAHEAGVKVIPWTVNKKEEIDALLALKVDGIISDYPNLF